MARARGGVETFMMKDVPSAASLMAVARRPSVAADVRAAAVRAVTARWSGAGDDAPLPELLALATKDGDPGVRAAALTARFALNGPAPAGVSQALLGAWQTERDPQVRFRIAERLEEMGVAFGPRDAFPVVYAARRRRTVDVAWIDPAIRWQKRSAQIVARRGGEERRIDAESPGGWSSGTASGFTPYLLPDPPLEGGPWDLSVELVLADAAETRTFSLALPALGGSAAPAEEPSTRAAPPKTTVTLAPVPPRARGRGCGCGLAPAPDVTAAALPLLVLLGVRRATVRKRRTSDC